MKPPMLLIAVIYAQLVVSTINSSRLEAGLDCPACSARIPWVGIPFGRRFPCPHCGSLLRTPPLYSQRTGVVSLVTTVLMAYLLGARNFGLLVLVVAGFFPVAMFVGWIGQQLIPPKLQLADVPD